jgi:Zn-dependent protease
MLEMLVSMIVSGVLHSLAFGAKLGVGIVLSMLIHELGHVIAAKIMGVKVSAPMFLPLGGAFVILKKAPRSAWAHAVIAAGGPFAGLLGGASAWTAAEIVSDPEWKQLLLLLAWWGFLLNLFQLLPIPPLDGSRMARVLRPWQWLVVCASVAVLGEVSREVTGAFHPLAGLLVVLGLMNAVVNFMEERYHRSRLVDRLRIRSRYRWKESVLHSWQRRAVMWTYAGTACLLLLFALFTWHDQPNKLTGSVTFGGRHAGEQSNRH